MDKFLQSFGEKYERVLLKSGICPICGDSLYIWKTRGDNGEERTPPVCPNCGYGETKKRNDEEIQTRIKDAKKKDAIDWMKRNSIVTDNAAWNHTFGSYQVVDQETDIAKKKAKYWAKRIIDGEPIHAILTGKPGAGKTHLCFAIANAVLRASNFKFRIAIISYRELLEQLKIGFNDKEVYKSIQLSIMRDIKSADLVIIDDLGAELGKIDDPGKPTDYNLDTLTSLVEARMHKPTIFTSNFNSNQLITLYGERIYSRIMSGAKADDEVNAIRFNETDDKRRKPARGGTDK